MPNNSIRRHPMTGNRKVMTDKQRIEALLNRKRPDRIPVWPFACNGFAVIYNKLPLAAAYTDPDACYEAVRKTCLDFGWVFWPGMMYASIGAWEFGGEIRMPGGDYDQAPMIIRNPVEKDDDVYNLKWPGPDSGFFPIARRYAELALQNKSENAPFNATIGAGGAFGLACNIVGTDRFLRWLIKKPSLAHYLLDTISAWQLSELTSKGETPCTEGVLCMSGGATSSNSLISPKQFEEFVLPAIQTGQKKLRALGYKTTYVHICGEHNLNLPYWAQVDFGDPGIIGVGHEVKLETAARYFPGNIILGNLEPAIVQQGTPEEVYEETKKVVLEGKNLPGGYIFSTGCDLPPRSPIENIKMMNKAVDDFGWYNSV
jgi:uroporphyrinogen decarboxylase